MWSGWFSGRRRAGQILIGQSYWAVHHTVTDMQGGGCSGWLDGLAHIRQVLDKWAKSRPRVQVWLSGAMCPALWLKPPGGLRADEISAWVLTATAAQHPLRSELGDPVVWVDSPMQKECIAAALPSLWLQQIRDAIGSSRIERIAPVWSAAFAGMQVGHGAGPSLCSAFDGESLTSLEFDGERVVDVSSLVGLTDLDQARSHHLRRSVRSGPAVARLMQLNLEGSAPDRQTLRPAWAEVVS